MGKRLATYVHVNGQVYGPDDDVPKEVADQITNPKAWGEQPAAEGKAKTAASSSSAKK